jgi:DNA-binding NtrC family response regulator
MEPRILLVDDDWDFLQVMASKLAAAGFVNVVLENDPVKASERLDGDVPFNIALIDMTMPEMNGIRLLEMVKTQSPQTECIMVTAVNDAPTAVECLRKGAYDYLLKPVAIEDLVFSLKRALERIRLLTILDIGKSGLIPELSNQKAFQAIVTRSSGLLRILKEAELHAGSDVPVLITGESGTGKELLARAIHAASPRANFPFTPVNMAALTGGLFESEFFGHTRGAFTGAEKDRSGYLRYTHRGTMFLDEIGNMSPDLQGKLLRVLQDGEFSKLGTSERQKVDVRFIAATNEDLESMMLKRMFRKDLYYRIRGGWIHLPPLRERTEDIPLLVDHFLKEYCAPSPPLSVDEQAMCLLMSHKYPGNIRELRTVIQSGVNLAQGRRISRACLPHEFNKTPAAALCSPPQQSEKLIPLAEVEKAHIIHVYERLNRNKSRTASVLKIGLNTLRRKLKSYGTESPKP